MAPDSTSLSREELVAKIREAAAQIGTERLGREQFLQQSGLSGYAVNKHFDRWTEALRESGLSPALNVTELPPRTKHSLEAIVAELRRVALLVDATHLTREAFSQYGQMSASAVARRFGGWSKALQAAGLLPAVTESPTERELIEELRRVAAELQSRSLTRRDFKRLSVTDPHQVERQFGGWHNALARAGLGVSPAFKREVPLTALAHEYLRISIELGRPPTLLELTRRSRHAGDTFSRKHGGYRVFRLRAIETAFASGERIPRAIREAFESLQAELASPSDSIAPPATYPRVAADDLVQRGILASLHTLIESCKLPNLSKELEYSNVLADYLRSSLPEDARVEREYRHEGTTCDIYIACQNEEAFLEVKWQLRKKADYDRLIGQVEGLKPRKNNVVVVMIGDTNQQLLGRLQAHFAAYVNDRRLAIERLP